ncbi:rod shape-determining RodA domain protein, partial [Vibrio parahaemolyticus V-223/04]
SFQESICHF